MNWPLKNLLPESTAAYCYQLWAQHDYKVSLVAPRISKLGDYRFRKHRGLHQITLNRDLNPYALLMVYLHEVAHYLTTINYGREVRPHGPQWQHYMRQLASPLLQDQQLPPEFRDALTHHLRRPTATTCSSPELLKVLRKFDPRSEMQPLIDIKTGQEFIFRKTRYRKLELRRTRISCRRLSDKSIYLIPKLALVSPV